VASKEEANRERPSNHCGRRKEEGRKNALDSSRKYIPTLVFELTVSLLDSSDLIRMFDSIVSTDIWLLIEIL